jgi:hypothetical protein
MHRCLSVISKNLPSVIFMSIVIVCDVRKGSDVVWFFSVIQILALNGLANGILQLVSLDLIVLQSETSSEVSERKKSEAVSRDPYMVET